MELVPKNLWLNLTVVLPGMVTYGMWRIVILLIGYKRIDFTAIDCSIVLSLSVLLAVALIQQAIGISIEAALAGFVHLNKDRWKAAHLLFVERFSSLAKNKYNEDIMRTIGQFFLSLNLAVGQVLILVFIVVAKNHKGADPVTKPSWLYFGLAAIILIATIVAGFRYWNAIEAIRPSNQRGSES